MRPCIVYPFGKKYIILGGNMRYQASKQNLAVDVPCIIVPKETSIEKLKEIVIKDNGSFGNWDYDELANCWDNLPLTEWGVPAWNTDDIKPTEALSGLEYDPLYYEPQNKPNLVLSDCIDDSKYQAKVAALDEYNLSPSQKEVLKMFAYRFLKIDFEAVANYYFFNASEEEKKAIERLRLVLVDNGSVGGFLEDELIRVADISRIDAENYEG
jgi:hypothetical protein